jgi:hypothetical protein
VIEAGVHAVAFAEPGLTAGLLKDELNHGISQACVLLPGLGVVHDVGDVRAFITRTKQECQCCKHGWGAQRDKPRCCTLGQCCDSRLSARMVQSIHAVLRNALESAVREEIIPRNVAKLVQVSAPRYKTNRGLSASQAKATMAAAAGHRLSALYVLAPARRTPGHVRPGHHRSTSSSCLPRRSRETAASDRFGQAAANRPTDGPTRNLALDASPARAID